MSHKSAIIFLFAALGGMFILDVFMDFMLKQLGLWFALPSFLLIIGLIYWIGFQNSASKSNNQNASYESSLI